MDRETRAREREIRKGRLRQASAKMKEGRQHWSFGERTTKKGKERSGCVKTPSVHCVVRGAVGRMGRISSKKSGGYWSVVAWGFSVRFEPPTLPEQNEGGRDEGEENMRRKHRA